MDSNDSFQMFDDSMTQFLGMAKEKVKTSDLRNITLQAEQILRTIENQIALVQTKKAPRNQSLHHQRVVESTQKYVSAKITSRAPLVKRPISAAVHKERKPIVTQSTTPTLPTNPLYDNTISMSNYKLDAILGRGAYATVRLSTSKHSKQQVAIKIYEKHKLTDQTRMTNLKREIELLKELDHPNIIKLYHAVEDKRSINLVMEYISSQSLAVFAKSKPNRQISNETALNIFFQLSNAIKYLHDKCIAHRDIKMENILLDPQGNIKLIDFGFSIKVPKAKKLNIFCGTPSYMSPEIVSKTPHVPFSSDIWSLGVLLSTMITGQHPFKGSNDRDLYRNIQMSKWKAPEGVKVPECIVRIINGCLEKSQAKRWSVNQILEDAVFLVP